MSLADIPLIEARNPGALARAARDRLPGVLKRASAPFPRVALACADRLSRHWLARTGNPLRDEIRDTAALLASPGTYTMNLSLEWACTAGSALRDGAPVLCRTLDWPLDVGADVVVGLHDPLAGHYLNVTWPGFVGVITGMAQGRFAASINQAPRRYALGTAAITSPIDWAAARVRMLRGSGLPPPHLLRQVFEQCATYQQARQRLIEAPLSVPALFMLTGTRPGEACVIERRETEAAVSDGACIANSWLTPRFKGRPRPPVSAERQARMGERMPRSTAPLDWLRPPILQAETRLAVEMNAATGHLIAQGFHGATPRTKLFERRAPSD